MTPMATLVLALAASALQDPPPPRPEPESRERSGRSPQEIEREMAALAEEIKSLPSDSPALQEKIRRLQVLQAELAGRRRSGPADPVRPRGARPPEPPEPPAPPALERGRAPLLREPDAVRAWLRENEPETFRRISQLENDGRRGEAQELLAQAQGRMRGWAEMKERDPLWFEKLQALRQMERECLELSDQARRATLEQRVGISERLKELLGRLFEAREEARSRELAEMKRRVEEIEKSLAARRASKEKIVERRRRELLGEKSDDDW